MTAAQPFTDRVVSHLRLADHRLRTSEPGSSRRRYSICRMTMHNITQVDSFYVGFFHGDDMLVIPYIFDHDRSLQPDITKFSRRGPSYWVRSSGKPYVYSEDDGGLLSRTILFGNEDEITLDAVIVPLKEPDTGEVVGLMSIQSLTAGVYDDEVVAATAWLGEALMLAQARDQHVGTSGDSLYTAHPELNSARSSNPEERFKLVSEQLEWARRRATELTHRAEQLRDEALVRESGELRMTLEQVQVDLAEWMLTLKTTGDGLEEISPPRADLTAREHEIAAMIASERLSNGQIAERLGISLKTVKTHVGNILSKLGVGQRSAIVFAMADLLAQRPEHDPLHDLGHGPAPAGPVSDTGS